MTAANAAAMSSVNLPESRPMTGAARMPASPARNVETIHTPAAMRDGLLPDSEVIASESTIARTLRPGLGEAQDQRADDHDGEDAPVGDDLVEGHRGAEHVVDARPAASARPGAWKISSLPKIIAASAGITTERPMVTTTLISCDESRRNRKIAR